MNALTLPVKIILCSKVNCPNWFNLLQNPCETFSFPILGSVWAPKVELGPLTKPQTPKQVRVEAGMQAEIQGIVTCNLSLTPVGSGPVLPELLCLAGQYQMLFIRSPVP